jgi:hypothetical protein
MPSSMTMNIINVMFSQGDSLLSSNRGYITHLSMTMTIVNVIYSEILYTVLTIVSCRSVSCVDII